jgi:hypothetical protein
VTSDRFIGKTRLGYGQMAYGQSALMVQLLLDHYGADSVPGIFRAIGRGASPTEAFVEVFGPFAPLGAAFDASIADLAAQYPPGLYPLTSHPRADGVPVLAVVAGAPGEQAVIEIWADGALVDREDVVLDPVGFNRVVIDEAVRPGPVVVRVSTPSLGELETALTVEPAAQFPRPAAPVQIPRTGGVLPPPVHGLRLRPVA